MKHIKKYEELDWKKFLGLKKEEPKQSEVTQKQTLGGIELDEEPDYDLYVIDLIKKVFKTQFSKEISDDDFKDYKGHKTIDVFFDLEEKGAIRGYELKSVKMKLIFYFEDTLRVNIDCILKFELDKPIDNLLHFIQRLPGVYTSSQKNEFVISKTETYKLAGEISDGHYQDYYKIKDGIINPGEIWIKCATMINREIYRLKEKEKFDSEFQDISEEIKDVLSDLEEYSDEHGYDLNKNKFTGQFTIPGFKAGLVDPKGRASFTLNKKSVEVMKLLSDVQHRITSIDKELQIEVYWTNDTVYLKFIKPTEVYPPIRSLPKKTMRP